MRPRLILMGPIGCGKSSLIRSCLGEDAAKAGGFVTLRRVEGDRLLGFDLAPARALVAENAPRQCFLDFTGETKKDNGVFEIFGTQLLAQAGEYPFAVADEFGGMELENEAFRGVLYAFLSGDTPCVGVLKNPQASAALTRRTGLGGNYPALYAELKARLEEDPQTELLPVTGWADRHAQAVLETWAKTYLRT